MNILIISDHLSNSYNAESIKRYKWDDELPTFLGAQGAVILDFSFIDDKRFNEIKRNVDSIRQLVSRKDIDQDNIIMVIVCGSEKIDYSEEKEGIRIKKYSYDFIEDVIPEYEQRVQFFSAETCFEQLSIKHISIRKYLELVKEYYLIFRYDYDAECCANVTPLAKVKRGTNACVAFEHKIGKGIVIILPGYDENKLCEACFSLIKICKNYFKVREDCYELELDLEIPQEIKDNYNESLICFLNDLYNSSCVQSGRALEVTLKLLGAKGNTIIKQLNFLYSNEIMHPRTYKLVDEIRILRNQGAHFNIDESLRISEEEARNMLIFFKTFLYDIQPLEKIKKNIEKIIKEHTK